MVTKLSQTSNNIWDFVIDFKTGNMHDIQLTAVGGNGKGSKESIAIELSNIGPLTLDGTDFKNVYGSKYCSVLDVTAFTEYSDGFRGYKHFATFTNEQYNSLQALLLFLTTKICVYSLQALYGFNPFR